MPRPIPQPAEDMYGRPTGPRHEDVDAGRETPGTHTSIDELPDGESVQSDKGETPTPSTHRDPEGKPAPRGRNRKGQTPVRS